jgi:hypothetical protein
LGTVLIRIVLALLRFVATLAVAGVLPAQVPAAPGQREITIPTLDISQETHRHVAIAAGTDDVYQGHATTVLPDP